MANLFDTAFSGIAEIAEKANGAKDGDYIGEDGLLYCGNCHTPKQYRMQHPFIKDKISTVHIPCECKKAKLAEEIKAKERFDLELEFNKQRYKLESDEELLFWLNRQDYKISPKLIAERTEIIRRICFGEDINELSKWTFENAGADAESIKIMTAMRNFVDKFDAFKAQGKGLILFGTVGTGKSFAAACVANALIDRGIPARMTNFAHIRNAIQKDFEGRQDYLDSLNKFPLLILDDLAAESQTEYMQEIVFSVIDARSRAGLPLIITTNLTAEQMKKPKDHTYKRVFSRLLGMCIPIEVKGLDRRMEQLKTDFKPMMDLLGL